MFYRIAIVQNEKEVFKYDCADWNNLFKDNSNFSFYKLAYFDEHNISKLIESIQEYDAIFFATNAFNSSIIYNACEKDIAKLENYIISGKGFYIGYSSKNKSHSFLPEKYRIEQIERNFNSGESEMDGELFAIQHPLTEAHKTIDLKAYIHTATHHTTIAGLYFDYLNFEDKHDGIYDKIIIDKNQNRPLMVCTKSASGMRLVVSTLPIDWQRQMDLFVNVVKFCTEGEPIIKILSQESSGSNDFSREYLARQLNLYKRPFLFESISSIDEVDLTKSRYETIIFDCSWKDKDVDAFCEKNIKLIYNKNIRILHYYNYKSSRNPIYKLTVHSAFQQVDLIEESILIAIEGRTPTAKDKFSYDSSLLSTYEAIKLLQENGIYNEDLYAKIVETGKKRLLNDGSYDAMFVASSNFYAVWKMCDKNAAKDKKFVALQKYIMHELFEKGEDNISQSEKAQVLYFLSDSEIISEKQKCQLLTSIMKPLLMASQEDIFGYGISNCWNIFSGNLDIVLKNGVISERDLNLLIKNLFSLLGDAKNDCKIVILSNYIITLSNLLQSKVVTRENELRILYRLLFNAISQIYDRRENLLWNDDIYSSCYAIKALKKFSELSTYPIDEILTLSQPNSTIFAYGKDMAQFDYTAVLESTTQQTNELIKTRAALEEANRQVEALSEEVEEVKEELKTASKEKESLDDEFQRIKKESKLRKAIDIIGRIAIVGLVFSLVQMVYVVINHRESFLEYFKSFNSFLSWVLVGISTIITLVTFIRFFRKKK